MTAQDTQIPEDIDQIASDIVRSDYSKEVEPDYALYRAIARAILAERQRDKWQPIETAPRDGTDILALTIVNAEEPMIIVRYLQGNASAPYYWSRLDGSEAYLTAAFAGWQPLPAAPKGGEA